MTARDDALADLGLLCSPDASPALTSAEVGRILEKAQVVDQWGRAPGDEFWEPTWDLNYAAAMAYGVKAGKVAGDFSFSADGASYGKADVMAKLLEMQSHYAAKCHGLMLTVGPLDTTLDRIADRVIP